MVRIITLVLPEILLEKIDEKRKQLGISRSEYLRSLIIKDLRETYEQTL